MSSVPPKVQILPIFASFWLYKTLIFCPLFGDKAPYESFGTLDTWLGLVPRMTS